MKTIYQLIQPSLGKGGILKYVLLGILSGLWGFLFVNLITKVISLIVAGGLTGISNEYLLVFATIILLTVLTRRTLSLMITRLSQKIFWSFRKDILALVLQANYFQLSTRKVKIYSTLMNDVNVLTNATLLIIDFCTSTIVAIASLVYLASISFPLFLISLVVVLSGMAIYYFGLKKNEQEFEDARKLEDNFISNLNHILNGFKEIFMEPKRGRFIYDHKIQAIAGESFKNNMAAFTGFLNNQIIGTTLFNLLIVSILLFFSIQLQVSSANTISFVFVLMYLLTSVETIMNIVPSLVRSKISAGRLIDLKKELEEANFNNPIAEKYISKDEFEHISVRNLQFHYGEKENSFTIGPINLTIQKGEVVFIYGENGSGKTTLVNSILGICNPSEGEIKLNGVPVHNDNYPSYRTLFSVVFSDFYLFNEVLETGNFNTDKWNYYLCLFEIEDKVKLEGKTFSTTNLSTGQRKRLALIIALLEEKPVLVIDEWAADQDPYFRKKFYTQIIPLLKKEGLTIIAITHDDKYYHCSDKLYKMEYGQLMVEDVLLHSNELTSSISC